MAGKTLDSQNRLAERQIRPQMVRKGGQRDIKMGKTPRMVRIGGQVEKKTYEILVISRGSYRRYIQYCMISDKMGQLYCKISPPSVSLKEPFIEIDSFLNAKFEE